MLFADEIFWFKNKENVRRVAVFIFFHIQYLAVFCFIWLLFIEVMVGSSVDMWNCVENGEQCEHECARVYLTYIRQCTKHVNAEFTFVDFM